MTLITVLLLSKIALNHIYVCVPVNISKLISVLSICTINSISPHHHRKSKCDFSLCNNFPHFGSDLDLDVINESRSHVKYIKICIGIIMGIYIRQKVYEGFGSFHPNPSLYVLFRMLTPLFAHQYALMYEIHEMRRRSIISV